MERNGPGGMKTESRSPMSTSGVATPNSHATSNMAVVIVIPATVPASTPARSAFVLLIERLSILQLDRNVEIKLCSFGSVVAALAAASISTIFRTQFATTSQEFSSRRRKFRAMCPRLSILRHCDNDGRPALREYAERHAQHASASQDSNHRFAHACRAAQVHPAESRETDTCQCNERYKGIAK